MRNLFVDTSAWVAIEDRRDRYYTAALRFKDEIVGRCLLITSDYILDEAYTLLLINTGYTQAVQFHRNIDLMSQAGILKVVHISEEIIDDAWKIFERYNIDKTWSFTDCTSFVIMKLLNIDEAFTFDQHFDQMGYIRLPV